MCSAKGVHQSSSISSSRYALSAVTSTLLAKVFSCLLDEFATLQHLHATTLESLKSNELVLCFSNQLRLHLKSTNWRPTMIGASLELLDESAHVAKSSYKLACLQLMQDRLKVTSASDDVPNVSVWLRAGKWRILTCRKPIDRLYND